MVILLGLAAAALYGSGDFLGGLASRKTPVLVVLTLADTAGVIGGILAATLWPGPIRLAGLAWGVSGGAIGGIGMIIFYVGLAAGPMSVVAPVSGVVAVVVPVAAAIAEGERPGTGAIVGAILCLVAIVLASTTGENDQASAGGTLRPGRAQTRRAILYGIASGTAFGIFFLFIRNAGESGQLWPVAAGRIGELAAVLFAAVMMRTSPVPRGAGRTVPLTAVAVGVIDVIGNICYVAATRTGMFGVAVVLASLYPGVTVLLARVVLSERLRWVQRVGLVLAGIGVLLISA